MGKPRFTDLRRYPHGYTPASETDVGKTFRRIRDQQSKNLAEAKAKTIPLKRSAK